MPKELKCTRLLLVCLVVAIVCALAVGVHAQREPTRSHATEAIRPFPKINVSQGAIDKLRRRITDTQWPEKETVADSSQGVPLATMQELARYWATDYDWRKAEAKLNSLPQFRTTCVSGWPISPNGKATRLRRWF